MIGYLPIVLLVVFVNEVLAQWQDVFPMLTQWGRSKRQHVDSVVQVVTELAL
jgi:hypothetical protein